MNTVPGQEPEEILHTVISIVTILGRNVFILHHMLEYFETEIEACNKVLVGDQVGYAYSN